MKTSGHRGQEIVGELIEIELGKSGISILTPTEDMVLKRPK